MNYPFWDTSLSYGLLMAVVAVLHVFVSHFAIGGGLYLVVTERWARQANDTARLEYLQRLSKFFIMVTLPFGALSGVGIWFVIGVLNPGATEVLIHNFVWGWATEWTFFIVEIASALLYFYGWKRMSARDHMALGWIYFIAAWLSLVVINGILAFMLTPGKWLQTGTFWDGFFNATYWPTLVFRTGVCIMLAGIYALLVASGKSQENRPALVKYNSIWVLVGLAIMAPTLYWYWHSIPAEVITKAEQIMRIPMRTLNGSFWVAGIIALVTILFGLLVPRWFRRGLAIFLMIMGLLWFGHFEWFRESIRKPYVISGFMFGNGIETSKLTEYQSEGMLKSIQYRTNDIPTDLFNHACRSCHTMNGYNSLRAAFDGTDSLFVTAMVKQTALMRGNMPPFAGTDNEARLIAAHIYAQTDHRPLGEIYGLSDAALGKKVYDLRCGVCHIIGSPGDKTKSIAGLTSQDYRDMLLQAQTLGDGMPEFTASNADKDALILYLTSLKAGGTDAGTK